MFEPRPAALAVSVAVLGALFIAGCASRQPPRGGPQGGPPGGGGKPGGPGVFSLEGGQVARPVALLFTGMDLDQNHVVDPAELSSGIAQEWASLPRSSHEMVSSIAMSEWAAHALGNAEALPNPIAFDVNMDGQVSQEEFETRLREEFARLDRDHDGRLTRAEMLSDLPSRSDSRGGMPGGQPPGRRSGRWRASATLIRLRIRRPSGSATTGSSARSTFPEAIAAPDATGAH